MPVVCRKRGKGSLCYDEKGLLNGRKKNNTDNITMPKKAPRSKTPPRRARTPTRKTVRKISTANVRAAAKDPEQRSTYRQKNPKKPGSAAYGRYEKYKGAGSVAQAMVLGARTEDIQYDGDRRFFDSTEEAAPPNSLIALNKAAARTNDPTISEGDPSKFLRRKAFIGDGAQNDKEMRRKALIGDTGKDARRRALIGDTAAASYRPPRVTVGAANFTSRTKLGQAPKGSRAGFLNVKSVKKSTTIQNRGQSGALSSMNALHSSANTGL